MRSLYYYLTSAFLSVNWGHPLPTCWLRKLSAIFNLWCHQTIDGSTKIFQFALKINQKNWCRSPVLMFRIWQWIIQKPSNYFQDSKESSSENDNFCEKNCDHCSLSRFLIDISVPLFSIRTTNETDRNFEQKICLFNREAGKKSLTGLSQWMASVYLQIAAIKNVQKGSISTQ